MRKTRSDAKLLNLPEEQQAQIVQWLLAGASYLQAQQLIKKEFGLGVSLSSLSYFHSQAVQPHLLRRRSAAVAVAEEIATEAESNPGRFDQATIDALKQKAFELAIAPNADPGDVKSLFMLLQKARDHELKERQVGLAENKFQFDAAKACLEHLPKLQAIAKKPGLDDWAKIDAIRQALFGTPPAEPAKT